MLSEQEPFRHQQLAVNGSALHVVEAGSPDGAPVLFLHGWPESWRCWKSVMRIAGQHGRAIALDLPGIGQSRGAATDGSKQQLADVIHELIVSMDLHDVTLVGQDVGGMIVFAYVHRYHDLARAVIMNVAIPGVDPWNEVLRNPHIWHFAFHSIPALPERLVQGRQAEYFGFFYDVLAHDPARITPADRDAYAAAYATDSALTAGFDWYRAFPRDAAENQRASQESRVTTPLLYLRGEHESGDINAYATGLRASGLEQFEDGDVPGAGHFTPEEAPDATWDLIANFVK